VARARDRQEGQGLRPHRPQAQAAGHRAAARNGLRPAADAEHEETEDDIAKLDQELAALFDNSLYLRNTIESDPEATKTKKGALIELFKKQRPGEPPSVDAAYALLQQLFFDPKRYDLTRVGRYKLNSRLSLDVDLDTRVLTHDDIHALVKELVSLPKLLGMPEEPEAEIKDYAAEAASYPASRSPSTSTSTSTSATAACARSASSSRRHSVSASTGWSASSASA